MKKYLSGIFALVSAIVLSSFTAPASTIVSFHFIPPNGAEYLYEDASRWEVAASSFECMSPENDVCILRIAESKLYGYSGTDTQKLAAYLADQGAGSLDFINATQAVNYYTYSKKP